MHPLQDPLMEWDLQWMTHCVLEGVRGHFNFRADMPVVNGPGHQIPHHAEVVHVLV